MADATDSKSVVGNNVWVQVPPPVPYIIEKVVFILRECFVIKIKRLFIFISCICFLYGNFGIVDAKDLDLLNTKVYLTGNGIATRLHKPVLEEFPNINIEFIHLSEELSKTNDLVVPSNSWLFLGTPVYKHKQHILGCAGTCKNILCEKPVGLSTFEIDQIKKSISQNQVLFIVNYALRFLPCVERIREFIKNNDVKSITITCNTNFNQNPPNKPWKDNYKLGGGVLYSILPHMIDLLNYLNFQENLSDITFQSTTQVPMNDIQLNSKTLSGVNTVINIDLCKNFDELTLKIETSDKSTTFDLVDVSENRVSNTKYCNGTLSATSKISPWRISFKYLLKSLFISPQPQDSRFANIEDAENVLKVLDVILLQQKTQ